MKKDVLKYLMLLLLILQFSCVKNLDFDQAKDFEASPVYTSSLVYFTLDQHHFLYQGYEINEATDVSEFKLLKSDFIQKNLIKLELEFKISNQFDRKFEIKIDFLDDSDAVTYSVSPFVISPKNTDFKQNETIVIASNQSFLTSTKIRIHIEMSSSSNGAPLNPNDTKTLTFKSAATVYLKEH